MANVPITSLPQTSTVAKTDQLILQGNSTQRATLAKILSDLSIVNPDMAQDTMLRIMVPDGAGAHNTTFRGKNLGGSLTSAQAAQISAGTFQDMYLGDYWSIDGVNYLIAGFDYWLLTGETPCTKHHVAVIPQNHLYTTVMNDADTTEGGYVGSKMYKTGLDQAKQIFTNAFGAAHILNHSEWLVNAVSNGVPSGGGWFDSTIELPNENMMYGSHIFAPASDGSTIPKNYTVCKAQLPLFRLAPQYNFTRSSWCWLRDVISATIFAVVSNTGDASCTNAPYVAGVRPVGGIC